MAGRSNISSIRWKLLITKVMKFEFKSKVNDWEDFRKQKSQWNIKI